MKIKIVNYTKNHVDSIYEIETLSFKTPWDKKSLEDELLNPVATYLVAEYNSVAIGYIGVWRVIDEGHITNIAVHPDYRGKKIASVLIETLIDKLEQIGITKLTLEVRKSNYTAQHLYKKYGFKEAGIRKKYYNDNKEDAIIMWRK